MGTIRLPFLTGNVAFAMGATAGGCKFYAAYPMSPATGILHWFCENGAAVGVAVWRTAQASTASPAVRPANGKAPNNIDVTL